MTTTTSPKKTITSLPDLCLLTIFDSVPLNDIMVNVSLTCKQWHSLRSWILSRRTELHLKLCKQQHYALNDLVVGPRVLKLEQAFRLTSIFDTANIGSLCLEYFGQFDTDDLRMTMTSFATLLRLWAHKPALHTVSMFYENGNPAPTSKLTNMFGDQLVWALNSMSCLKVLRLSLWLIADSLERRPFPILATLNCIEVRCNSHLASLSRWIAANYARNRRLEIRIQKTEANLYVDRYLLDQIYRSQVPLDQFTGFFPLPEVSSDVEPAAYGHHLNQFLGRFPRLTEFSIGNNRGLNIGQISRCLAHLPALRHLHLNLFASLLTDTSLLLDGGGDGDDSDSVAFRALPSVRQLTLCLNPTARSDNLQPGAVERWLQLPHGLMFPGLVVLRIKFETDLRRNHRSGAYSRLEVASRTMPIVKQYARPYLQACPDLRLIEIVLRNLTNPYATYTPEQLKKEG